MLPCSPGQMTEKVVDVPVDPGPPIILPQRQQVGIQSHVKVPGRRKQWIGIRQRACPILILMLVHVAELYHRTRDKQKRIDLRHLSQTIGHLTQRNRPETGLSVLDEMRLRADVCLAKQWYDTFGWENTAERGRGGKRMTVKRLVPALIVAMPGRFRDSLRALLVAAPHIEAVDQADDAPSALKVVAARRPALVLLDTSLPGNQVWIALRQIKAERPETRCIILADNTRWQQEGNNSDADAVLLKGFLTAELFQTVERLLE